MKDKTLRFIITVGVLIMLPAHTCNAERLKNKEPTSYLSVGDFDSDSLVFLDSETNQVILTIGRRGKITIGKGFTPDEAALKFIEVLRSQGYLTELCKKKEGE